jgi:hypothetical protein
MADRTVSDPRWSADRSDPLSTNLQRERQCRFSMGVLRLFEIERKMVALTDRRSGRIGLPQ